jgi:hypothetical protein
MKSWSILKNRMAIVSCDTQVRARQGFWGLGSYAADLVPSTKLVMIKRTDWTKSDSFGEIKKWCRQYNKLVEFKQNNGHRMVGVPLFDNQQRVITIVVAKV